MQSDEHIAQRYEKCFGMLFSIFSVLKVSDLLYDILHVE